MVILQLLPEVVSGPLQPMEIHFNYESQEHRLLSGEKPCVISFLMVSGGGEGCYWGCVSFFKCYWYSSLPTPHDTRQYYLFSAASSHMALL